MAVSKYNEKTLTWMKKQGWRIGFASSWNAFSRRRHDLFGFIDYVGLDGQNIFAVQSTSYNDHSPHLHKITGECREAAKDWIRGGGEILLISWKAIPVQKKAGSKSGKITYRYEPYIQNPARLLDEPSNLDEFPTF